MSSDQDKAHELVQRVAYMLDPGLPPPSTPVERFWKDVALLVAELLLPWVDPATIDSMTEDQG